MRFSPHRIALLLLGTLLTLSFSLSVENLSAVIHDGKRTSALDKREDNSRRTKCSSKSCCHIPPPKPNDEDTEESDLELRSLHARDLFPGHGATLDADIVDEFTRDQVKLIFSEAVTDDASSSVWEPIDKNKSKFNIGLSALCGCTTLIVHSPNGVYGAHFFELAAWGRGDDAFQWYVTDFLQKGRGEYSGLANVSADLAANDAAVEAYILTPMDELPDDHPNAPGYVPNVALYADQVAVLVALLPTLVPALQGHIYTRLYEALEGGRDAKGNNINPAHALLLDTTTRGRVLFQYDPNDQHQRVSRLFFEDRLQFSRVLD